MKASVYLVVEQGCDGDKVFSVHAQDWTAKAEARKRNKKDGFISTSVVSMILITASGKNEP